MTVNRLAICAAGSLLAHAILGRVLEELPPRPRPRVAQRVEIRVVAPPPPSAQLPPPAEVAPPPPPEVAPPPPPPPPRTRTPAPRTPTPPRSAPVATSTPALAPSANPGAESGVVAPTATGRPVFGATMESTSQSGAGPAVPIGNSGRPGAGPGPAGAAPRGQGDPIPAAEVTRMPLPRGRCAGAYTDAARAAAIEGTVVLDLVVDERGRARDVVVVEGLSHGLSEAAVTALRTCPFSPGERGGQAVPVRVRGFKIRFVLQEAR